MDNGRVGAIASSAASRAAQSVATRDAGDPSTPTTMPWSFGTEDPHADVILLSLTAGEPDGLSGDQTLSHRPVDFWGRWSSSTRPKVPRLPEIKSAQASASADASPRPHGDVSKPIAFLVTNGPAIAVKNG